MNKKIKSLIVVLIVFLLIVVGFIVIMKIKSQQNTALKQKEGQNTELHQDKKEIIKLKDTEGITIVPTMRDEIKADSSWCGTFQLVWNDLKNDIAGQNIVFTPQEEFAENLNKEEFTEDMISEEYYFKKYGLKTLELKEEIEKGIKEKFNQESDILDKFDWSPEELHGSGKHAFRYFLYVMLYRKFDFLQEFDKLENAKFANKYNNIEYFGIDKNTKDSVGNQIDVLYYNSQNDFAVIINTKTNDEVILCKNPIGNNFHYIFENMNNISKKYQGKKNFQDVDEFKMPYLNIDIEKEYTELENKVFSHSQRVSADGPGVIQKALQTIKFKLNEKGGEIKSEAGIDVTFDSIAIAEPKKEKPRYFYVDDTFAIFLREKGKTLPYFAGRIDDITKFQ